MARAKPSCLSGDGAATDAGDNALTRLICVRHGKQIPTSERTAATLNDPPLADAGHKQARDRAESLAAGELRSVEPTVVVSSPMQRALQTAAPIAAAIGAPLIVHGGCYE